MKKNFLFYSFAIVTTHADGLFKGDGLGVPNPLYHLKTSKQNFTEKKFGVEVNPLYLLTLNDSEKHLSGTISFFDHSKNIEIAIPISYASLNYSNYKQYTLDIHYRKFLNNRLGESYVSGFMRYANLNGRLLNNPSEHKYIKAKQSKIGIGCGVGYRYFSDNRFYWGASISLGTYIGNNRDLEYDTDMFFMGDDNSMIIDIEFFKFGWSF